MKKIKKFKVLEESLLLIDCALYATKFCTLLLALWLDYCYKIMCETCYYTWQYAIKWAGTANPIRLAQVVSMWSTGLLVPWLKAPETRGSLVIWLKAPKHKNCFYLQNLLDMLVTLSCIYNVPMTHYIICVMWLYWARWLRRYPSLPLHALDIFTCIVGMGCMRLG